MYTGEAITRIMAFGDNVDPTDADYRPRRRRVLQWLQDGYDEVWNLNYWRWTRGIDSLFVPAASYEAPLPDDFGSLPEQGGIFSGARRLLDINDQIIQDIQNGVSDPGRGVLAFSIYGWSYALNRGVIQLNARGPLTLPMYYKRKPPQLADRPWGGLPTAAVGAAGVRTGTYKFLQTYTTQDGYEHEPSDIVTIVLAAQKVVLTPADPGPLGEHKVKYVNLYGTVAGGSVFYRISQVLFTSAGVVAVTDDTSDAALVALPAFVEQSPLTQIPETYHHTVLLPCVMAKAKRSKGDTRDWAKEKEAGLAQMLINERPRMSSVQRIPRSAPPGMW